LSLTDGKYKREKRLKDIISFYLLRLVIALGMPCNELRTLTNYLLRPLFHEVLYIDAVLFSCSIHPSRIFCMFLIYSENLSSVMPV
jgi:hypothetical protein